MIGGRSRREFVAPRGKRRRFRRRGTERSVRDGLRNGGFVEANVDKLGQILGVLRIVAHGAVVVHGGAVLRREVLPRSC